MDDWRWAWQGALRDTIASLPPLPPAEPRNQFTIFHEEFTPMAYPQAMAAANRLVTAVLEWDDARTVARAAVYGAGGEAAVLRYEDASESLEQAIAGYRTATAVEHVNGPDLDADRHGGQP